MISETEAETVRREVHANLSRGMMGEVQQATADIRVMSKRQKDHENAIGNLAQDARHAKERADQMVEAVRLILEKRIAQLAARAAKERRRAKRMRYVRGVR